MGDNTIASAANSIAIGYKTTASGAASFCAGDSNTAQGNGSVALGYLNTALGAYEMCVGRKNNITANADYSFAAGICNKINT